MVFSERRPPLRSDHAAVRAYDHICRILFNKRPKSTFLKVAAWMRLSHKIKKGVAQTKRKIKCNKKTREFISCTLSLHWLQFGSEFQPWLSKTRALTIWLSVGSVSFLFVTPQYPHYSVGVRDRCHASRTFGGRTVGYRWFIRHSGVKFLVKLVKFFLDAHEEGRTVLFLFYRW